MPSPAALPLRSASCRRLDLAPPDQRASTKIVAASAQELPQRMADRRVCMNISSRSIHVAVTSPKPERTETATIEI
jgi:hypothetical protein